MSRDNESLGAASKGSSNPHQYKSFLLGRQSQLSSQRGGNKDKENSPQVATVRKSVGADPKQFPPADLSKQV